MKVLIDTSFIVAAMENKIDLDSELRKFGKAEICVLNLVLEELVRLSQGKDNKSKGAKLALMYLAGRTADVIKAEKGSTDKRIQEAAEERGMSVCTIDRKLRDSLLKKGIEVITIRQGRYLAVAKKGGVEF